MTYAATWGPYLEGGSALRVLYSVIAVLKFLIILVLNLFCKQIPIGKWSTALILEHWIRSDSIQAWFASSCLPRSDPFLSTLLPSFCCHHPSLTKARVWHVEGWGSGVHIPFLKRWGRGLGNYDCLHSYCYECPGSISVPKGVLHLIVIRRTSLMRTYCVAQETLLNALWLPV